MKKKVMFLSCVVAAISLTTQAAVPTNARLSLNKNNVKVWTYQNTGQSVLSYKAETVLDVPIERAVALILDVRNSTRWVPNVAKAEVLSRDDAKGEFTLYMVLDFPFPLKDRDMVVKGKMYKDASGVISIKNTAVSKVKPVNPGYIRISDYSGDWVFQQQADGRVKVTTTGHANPEGAIPASVTNLLVEQQPYQMLQRMKTELAKNNSYQPLPEFLR